MAARASWNAAPLAALLSLAAACATAPPTEAGKIDIEDYAASFLKKAEAADPTLTKTLNVSAGFAVFPRVEKAAVGIGGAYGKGVLYENRKVVGYCDVSQQTIGVQLGGQTYGEILALETADAVSRFKSGRFTIDAQASAVAINAGAGATARFTNGVAAFTTNEEGLMVEASIGGQQVAFQAK